MLRQRTKADHDTVERCCGDGAEDLKVSNVQNLALRAETDGVLALMKTLDAPKLLTLFGLFGESEGTPLTER